MENLLIEPYRTSQNNAVPQYTRNINNNWQGPKTLTVAQDEDGYGFSLKYFLLQPNVSASTTKGFHRDSYWRDIGLHDEEEESFANAQTQPLNIFYTQNIKEGGPAHRVGLKSDTVRLKFRVTKVSESFTATASGDLNICLLKVTIEKVEKGDRVVSINGQLIGGKSYKEVVETIESCNGDLKLGVLPHNEDILQSVYEEFMYDDKPLARKERSNSTTSTGSMKMFATPSINKWAAPLSPRKSIDSGSSSNDIFNNNNGELNEKRYEPCVQFRGGTPIITVEKSSRSNSISSSGTTTPRNRLSSGKISPGRRNSSFSGSNGNTSKFDPCVSFIAGKSVTTKNGGPQEDEKNISATDLHAQKLQSALRKEVNKKSSVGKRLAPKMIEGVTKPGAVSSMKGRFGGNGESNLRRPSVTSCLRDDFQSSPRKINDGAKENLYEPDNRNRNDILRQVNQRKPLTSLTSQATLVESSGKLTIDKNNSNSFILNKNGQKHKTTSHSRERNLMSNSRKMSVSSSVENSDDEESYVDSADENELNNWQGRRSSYLRIEAAKKEEKKKLNGEANAEADDEDSDTNITPTKQQANKNGGYEAKPIIKEGPLNRKLEKSLDRKKPSQRTWKPIYAVLKGHRLFCYKDGGNEAFDDEIIQPIPVRSSTIKIASDYTKKRHVFRLVTSHGNEYLFQAEDTSSLMSWVHTLIDHNPDPDGTNASTRQEKKENNQTTSPSTKSHSVKDKKNGSTIRRAYERTIRKSRSNTVKQNSKDGPVEVGRTFGNSLQNCPQAKEVKNVPLLVEHCCNVIEQKGKEIVGIYRVPGNAAAYQALQVELDTKDPDEINWTDEKWYELNNIGSLLKSFLRKLEEPVIPTSMYNKFIEANRLGNPLARLKQLKQLVKALPEYHYDTLLFLIRHLKVIADHSDENKMEPTNLAIVFGPTVVRTKEQTMVSLVENMSDQCKIIETLVKQCDWMFSAGNEDPSNIEQEGDVVSSKAAERLQECLDRQNKMQQMIYLGSESNSSSKKSTKFGTLKFSSMKRGKNSTKVTSPKPVKKNSKSGSLCDHESDLDTSGCSSQSPQMSDKSLAKNKLRSEETASLSSISNTIPIPNFTKNSATQIGSFPQNSNIKLKFESSPKSPDINTEFFQKDGSGNSHKLSEKTMNRLNKMTSVFTKGDDSAKYITKDDGNDSGVISPQRFDSDENISMTSDSATSSRKESLDSLSAPSPRINRRVGTLPRKCSAGSGGSSNEEKSPTLSKSSVVSNIPTCPSVQEETITQNDIVELKREVPCLQGSVTGTTDTRGPDSMSEDLNSSVVKRSEWRQKMNLPISPRSAKRTLISIMPGDGNNFDEKIRALLDNDSNSELKEQAKNEMNLSLSRNEMNLSLSKNEMSLPLFQTKDTENSLTPTSPTVPNSEWWLSGVPNRKVSNNPKDKTDAVNIISSVIETRKRSDSESKDHSYNPIDEKNHKSSSITRRTNVHLPRDPDLTARFDNLKQKEENYHKKVDSILASSSSHSIGKDSLENDSSNNIENNKKSFLSQARADKLDTYLKQVSQLLEECGISDLEEDEKEKINNCISRFKCKTTKNETQRIHSDSQSPAPIRRDHKTVTRSKSANSAPRKEIFKNRTSPFLDPTYSSFNYNNLYPRE